MRILSHGEIKIMEIGEENKMNRKQIKWIRWVTFDNPKNLVLCVFSDCWICKELLFFGGGHYFQEEGSWAIPTTSFI